MVEQQSRSIALSAKLVGVASLAALAAACASGGKQLDNAGSSAKYKDAIAAYSAKTPDMSGLDPIAAAAYWGAQYDRNPTDASAAVAYSAALRQIGSTDKAVTVMTRSIAMAPDNPDVDLEMGRTLIESGRAFEAVRYLEEASAARPGDWKALSAYGVALDQIGEHKLARNKYELALAIAPGNASLLNNKALSFALSGDLSKAAQIMRTAATMPTSDARMRQNLALVLAIKGDMTEAERLARSDLPPQIADQNIDYLRSLMVQPAYWQSYASDTAETPSFDAPAAAFAPAQPMLPTLKEEPKPEAPKATPLAQGEVQPVTKTSAPDAPAELFVEPEEAAPASDAPEVLAPDLKSK